MSRMGNLAVGKVMDLWVTGVPPQLPQPGRVELLYLNTDMMFFVAAAVLVLTFTAIFLGQRIADTRLTVKSFASYLAIFGFVAPIWLARAAWGAILARESVWR